VSRTRGRDTPKNKKFRAVPIPAALRPFGEVHLAATPGEELFPRLRELGDGAKVYVLRELRRALCRAGLVLGHDHLCRRRGCGFRERRTDAVQGTCPKCGMRLWITSIPKPLTFHQLRHSYVSHLIMAGANPVAVQRMAGHADLKTTLDIYGHLAPGFMRGEAERLRFGTTPPPALEAAEPLAASASANESRTFHGHPSATPQNEAGGPCGTARSDSAFPPCPQGDSNPCYRLERPAS